MLEIFSWSIAKEKKGNDSIYPSNMAKERNEYIWNIDTECYSNEEAERWSSEAPGPWSSVVWVCIHASSIPSHDTLDQ